MGMAAHQSRFLALTSRQNSIGLQLTQLSAQKMSLARDMQKVSKKYNDGISQKVLTWSNNAGINYAPLTYNTFMSPNSMNGNTPYFLSDCNGKIVLDSKYAKYAKMISPNGAPTSGSWKNNPMRNYILGQVTGIDTACTLEEYNSGNWSPNSEWSAENWIEQNYLAQFTSGYNKTSTNADTIKNEKSDFYKWYAQKVYGDDFEKYTEYHTETKDGKEVTVYTGVYGVTDNKQVDKANKLNLSKIDYYEYKSAQVVEYQDMMQYFTGIADYYKAKIEETTAEHEKEMEGVEILANKDNIDFEKINKQQENIKEWLINKLTDSIYEALGGYSAFSGNNADESNGSINTKIMCWLEWAEDKATDKNGIYYSTGLNTYGSNTKYFMGRTNNDEWKYSGEDGYWDRGTSAAKNIYNKLISVLNDFVDSDTLNNIKNKINEYANSNDKVDSNGLLGVLYKQLREDIKSGTSGLKYKRGDDNVNHYNIDEVAESDPKYVLTEMIKGFVNNCGIDLLLNEENYDKVSGLINRYATDNAVYNKNSDPLNYYDAVNQPLLDIAKAQLQSGQSDATTMFDKLQTALDNQRTVFNAEDKATIDFYDKIFEAICSNGWVENNMVNDQEYLNNALQNNLYSITTQRLVEGDMYMGSYYSMGSYNDTLDTYYEKTSDGRVKIVKKDFNSYSEACKNGDFTELQKLLKKQSGAVYIGSDHYEYSSDLALNFDKIFRVSDSDAEAEALSEYEYQKTLIKAKESKIDTRMRTLETEQAAISERKKSLESMLKENTERLNIFNA